MLLNIDGNYFLEIKNINHVLTHKEEIINVKDEKELIKGEIKLIIDYFTNISDEFKSQEHLIEFEIMKEEKHKYKSIKIKDFSFNVIDNNGIDISYNLRLEIEEIKMEKKDILEEIKEIPVEIDDEEYKKIINDEIEQKLEKALETREKIVVREDYEETNVVEKEEIIEIVEEDNNEIVEEDNNENVEDEIKENNKINIRNDIEENPNKGLISFFINKIEEKESSYKIIYPEKEDNIEQIAKRYNKSIETLYKDSNYKVGDVIIIKND